MHPTQLPAGLSRVNVPDTIDPVVDPKTWKGLWQTLTKHDDISRAECKANASQYNQACITPFGSEPLLSHFGTDANTPGARKLLAGEALPIEVSRCEHTCSGALEGTLQGT